MLWITTMLLASHVATVGGALYATSYPLIVGAGLITGLALYWEARS